MPNHPAPALTSSGRRATAAVVVRAAMPDLAPLAISVAVDLLDGACAGVLDALGLSRDESRAVIFAMWEPER